MFNLDFVLAFGEQAAEYFEGLKSSYDIVHLMNTQEGIDFLGMYMEYDCIPI